MMIQGSSPITIASGLENNGAVAQGPVTEGGAAGAFSLSLISQFALLREIAVNNVTAETSISPGAQLPESLSTPNPLPPDVQNFAAFMKNNNLTAKKGDQGVNLDETLSALSDVLKYLQEFDADSSAPNGIAAMDNTDKPTKPAADSSDNNSDSLGGSGDVTLAALLLPQTQTIQQPTLQNQPNVSTLANDVSPPDANPSQFFNAIPDRIGIKTSFQDDGFSKLIKTSEVSRKVSDGQDQASIQTQAFDNAVFGVASNSSDPGQTSGGEQQFSGRGNSDPTVSAKQGLGPSTDQTPANVATDIAHLNQAVSTGSSNPTAVIDKNISHPQWNVDLGEKLIWMHTQDIPSVELRLNPRHMGPVSIKVDVDQGQANISFITHHAEVKEAIEAAIPKLREMLGDQQLNLADVNVSQQNQGKGTFQAFSGQNQGNNNAGQPELQDNPASQPVMDVNEEVNSGRAIASNGLLSIFA